MPARRLVESRHAPRAKPKQTAPPEGGRREQRRLLTRAALLKAAYREMSRVGVDDARLEDITERANIGFGTFYNYFESKEDLGRQVLDCVIEDIGRRNRMATASLRRNSQALVIADSMRLLMRDAIENPIWRWWALRPDMLVERVRAGVRQYAAIDSNEASAAHEIDIDQSTFESAWAVTTWVIVGGIRDIVTGGYPPEHIRFVVQSCMHILGVAPEVSEQIMGESLPDIAPPKIDWHFRLQQ